MCAGFHTVGGRGYLPLAQAPPPLLDFRPNLFQYATKFHLQASYLALHISLFGPVVQLIMIILSLTALRPLKFVNWLNMAHTLTIVEPCFETYQKL